jgi:hypothetical protein
MNQTTNNELYEILLQAESMALTTKEFAIWLGAKGYSPEQIIISTEEYTSIWKPKRNH